MSLLLNGCLVGSGGVVRVALELAPHSRGMSGRDTSMAMPSSWDTVFSRNHTPIQGVLYRAIPSFCTMMNVCNNGSFNGFWVECNVMRPGLMAPTGLELSFG